ncbi:MAG: ABC transporter permease [Ferruginibacter sp.]
MLRNYFKTAWRNLRRNQTYSAINLFGLAIGLAVCMLIILFVEHESSYDTFHKGANRIFWIQGKMKMGDDSVFLPKMSYATAPLVKQNDPSIESFTRMMLDYKKPVIQNIQSASLKFIDEKFLFADSNFFNFFSFKLLSGNKQQVLKNPFTVVISQSAAQKFFGKENPVGKIIRYNNAHNFTVTGVAENAPSNSSINYDFIASISSLAAIDDYRPMLGSQSVQLGGFSTYFLLKTPAAAALLEKTLLQLSQNASNGNNESYLATPFTSTHLSANYGNSINTKYLFIFPFIAALILLLALTNYVSLSTARSSVRAKEIGIRKVIGASRKSIAAQFFIESAVYTGISFIIACLLCAFFQPAFFSFLQIDIDTSFLYNPYLLSSFAALFMATVILASIYPAALLSAYKPVKVLYGKFSKSGGVSVRKFFIVFQFSISIVLIICGIVINKQIYYIKNTDTGVSKENIVMIPFAPSIGKHYPAFKGEMSSLAGIAQTATANYPMYKGTDIYFAKAYHSKTDVSVSVLSVDDNFTKVLGLKWKTQPSDPNYIQKKSMIINEEAISKLDLGEAPLNKQITIANKSYNVAGVLKDFNYETLQNKIGALCLFISTDTLLRWSNEGGCLFAAIKPHTNVHNLMQHISGIYNKYDNETPFQYSFMDEAYNNLYLSEERLSKILTVFTTLTILIACLGLFGLATFMAVQRTKEIGIRKVLGASVLQITSLISKGFVKLVLIAVVIAVPTAWWFMNKWLENFSYKTVFSWWIFIAAGLITVLLALVTVSFQAIKAAVANPVESLRSE